jgi:hypothetical protein
MNPNNIGKVKLIGSFSFKSISNIGELGKYHIRVVNSDKLPEIVVIIHKMILTKEIDGAKLVDFTIRKKYKDYYLIEQYISIKSSSLFAITKEVGVIIEALKLIK